MAALARIATPAPGFRGRYRDALYREDLVLESIAWHSKMPSYVSHRDGFVRRTKRGAIRASFIDDIRSGSAGLGETRVKTLGA